jgi:hypothetical protein
MNVDSNFPDWFLLMSCWLKFGKGQTGITLPFLAGALALKARIPHVKAEGLKDLIKSIESNPVAGYYVGVRRCGNIQAPVLSALRLQDPLIRKCEIRSSTGQVSLAFSPDAMNKLDGLDCSSRDSCIQKLISYALPHVESGNFSRVRNPSSGEFKYSRFTQDDIEFIQKAIGGISPANVT